MQRANKKIYKENILVLRRQPNSKEYGNKFRK